MESKENNINIDSVLELLPVDHSTEESKPKNINIELILELLPKYHLSVNPSTEEFYDKIRDNMPFNELYTLYYNLMKSHKLVHYNSFMVDNSNLISTLTLSLICCMKSIQIPNKREFMLQYLEHIINLIDTTEYEHRDYQSWTQWFENFFTTTPPLESILTGYSGEFITAKENINNLYFDKIDSDRFIFDDYYFLQENIHILLNGNYGRYHSEYINITTLGFYGFIKSLFCNFPSCDIKQIISNYLCCLVQINAIENHDNIGFFDRPNDQTMIMNLTSNLFQINFVDDN